MEIKKTCKKNLKNCGNVVISGNTIEYTQSNLCGKEIKWRKLKKGLYVNLDTGEYIEKPELDIVKKKNSNIKSVLQSIKRIRRIINCNFFGSKGSGNEWFITLTYKENMQDVNILYDDFNKFIKRLKYHLNDYNLKYINVVEPQERGAWHCHFLLKTNNSYKFTLLTGNKCELLDRLWGKGFVYCSRLDEVDNVGAYLSAYLTNTKDKKGQRLYLYPQNMRILRCSRNCLKPLQYKLFDYEFKEKFNNLKLKYVNSFQLINKGMVLNDIIYRSYEVI